MSTKLEIWLEKAQQWECEDCYDTLMLKETLAVIEKLKTALINQSQFADMLGHSDGADYANYAGHITMESNKALIDLDPEKL